MKHQVAVVGISCRLPEAQTIGEFWENCLSGRVSISPLHNQRWDHSEFYHPKPGSKPFTTTEAAALVTDIDLFAARHFHDVRV